MKTLNLIIAIAGLLVTKPASAELVIYKGTLKQSATGLGVSRKITSQFYLVVDHDTAAVGEIEYNTINGSKSYATSTETNLHIVQMSGPKGKSVEALAHSPNSCDISEGSTTDGVFLQGADSTLTVGGGSTITFPKMLAGGGGEVTYSQGPPLYIASTLLVSFDSTQTPLSNGNGETLDAAVARISTMLEGQGYTKQSEKLNGSQHPLNVFRP